MKVDLHSNMPFRATGVAAALAIVFSGFAQGAEISAAEAKALKAKVNEQAKRMEALKKQLADTDAKLQRIQQALGHRRSRRFRRRPHNSRPRSARAARSGCSRWHRSSNSRAC